jgi:hypothetical protein
MVIFHKLTVRSVYALNLPRLTPTIIRPLTERLSGRRAVVERGQASAPAEALPPRLASAAQWDRVVAAVERAIGRGERAVEYHNAARFRLDASDYELGRLCEELGALLQRPAGVLTLVSSRPTAAVEPRRVALAA